MPDRPQEQQIRPAAQKREQVIDIFRPALIAGGCPHPEFRGNIDKNRSRDKRRLRGIFVLLHRPQDALETRAGDDCADRDLIDVVQGAAELQVELQLPDIQGNGEEHQGMKIFPFLRCLNVEGQERQNEIRHIPAKIREQIGGIGRFSHDDQICRPEVAAEQTARKEADGIQPAALLAADVPEQGNEECDQDQQKLHNVFQKLHRLPPQDSRILNSVSSSIICNMISANTGSNWVFFPVSISFLTTDWLSTPR